MSVAGREPSQTTVVIIGAGVVGCAVACELSARGFAPWVLERGPRIAEGTTSRNSGVIHAGLYYAPGSLKAQSCIRGSALLYEWCAEHGVPHRKTGKWIVGGGAQEEGLLEIHANALASGARGLEVVPRAEVTGRLEPGIRAQVAMYSAETGIVDAYEYSRSLLRAAEERGAQCLTDTKVLAAERSGGGYRLETTRGEIQADIVVNAAGLHADEIARLVGINHYRIYPWKGCYFGLRAERRYRSLVYPVKEKGSAGLGVHLTLALDGSLKLGPDVESIREKEDYSEPARLEEKRAAFFEAASKYLEGIRIEQLYYDTCGVRPKLRSPEDKAEKDFVISQDLPGWINLMGIESPGLTASRDLAQRVAGILT